MSDLSIADVLDRAADELTAGWGQGGGLNTVSNEQPCAGYAIIFARPADLTPRESERIWDTALRLLGFEDVARLIDWNDDPERHQSEVVSAFRQAAARAREEGL